MPPSEYSEPSFITESYQTLHPISSEDLLSLKYESEYPNVILRDAPLNPLQGDYFSVKQEVVSPDNMCVGRISRGEYGPKVMCFDAFQTVSSCKTKIEASLNVLGDKSELLSSQMHVCDLASGLKRIPSTLAAISSENKLFSSRITAVMRQLPGNEVDRWVYLWSYRTPSQDALDCLRWGKRREKQRCLLQSERCLKPQSAGSRLLCQRVLVRLRYWGRRCFCEP